MTRWSASPSSSTRSAGSLLSVSASTDVANQQRLAGDVRALRDELGSLAEGMSEAFEERAA